MANVTQALVGLGASTAGTAATGNPAIGSMLGTLATGALGIAGTVANAGSAFSESSFMRQQGDIAYNEALLEADRVSEQGRQYKASQKMAYVMSGVSVAGTPMQVLQDTDLKVGDEIRSIKARGLAQRTLAYMKASQTQTKGGTGFLSGLTGTASTTSKLYNQAKAGGIFDTKKSKTKMDDIVDTGSWGGFA